MKIFKRAFLSALGLSLGIGQLALPPVQNSAIAATAKDRQRLNKLKKNETKIKVLDKKKKDVEKKIIRSKSELAKIQKRLEHSAQKLEMSSKRYDEVHQEV